MRLLPLRALRGASPRARGAVVAALLLSACAGPAAVRLTDAWPEQPGDYHDVTRAWTRHGRIQSDYDTVLIADATFKAPEWRAAWVARRAAAERLSEAETAELAAAQRAKAEKFYEVELLVATYHHRENDLQKGKRSMWRVALVDDKGNAVYPVEVAVDRRPTSLIAAEYPAWQPYHKAYRVRFPRSAAVLRDGAASFSLRIASVRGRVELVWQGQ